jgi:hypothetical protein
MDEQSATSTRRFCSRRRNYRTRAFWAAIGAAVVLFLFFVFECWDVLVAHYMLVG